MVWKFKFPCVAKGCSVEEYNWTLLYCATPKQNMDWQNQNCLTLKIKINFVYFEEKIDPDPKRLKSQIKLNVTSSKNDPIIF